jgi:hypothetical protein
VRLYDIKANNSQSSNDKFACPSTDASLLVVVQTLFADSK